MNQSLGIAITVLFTFALIFACNQPTPPERERRVLGDGGPSNQDTNNQNENETDPQDSNDTPSFTLAWNAGDNQVYEYRLYLGPDRENLELFNSYRHDPTGQGFNINSPELSIPVSELEFSPDENFCFRVIAVSIQGDSPPSEITCAN